MVVEKLILSNCCVVRRRLSGSEYVLLDIVELEKTLVRDLRWFDQDKNELVDEQQSRQNPRLRSEELFIY
jgi:hypothetical protein